MNILWLKLIAYFTSQKLVWVKDWDGDTTLTLAKVNPWGEFCAKVNGLTYRLYDGGVAERYPFKDSSMKINWKYYE